MPFCKEFRVLVAPGLCCTKLTLHSGVTTKQSDPTSSNNKNLLYCSTNKHNSEKMVYTKSQVTLLQQLDPRAYDYIALAAGTEPYKQGKFSGVLTAAMMPSTIQRNPVTCACARRISLLSCTIRNSSAELVQ